MSKLSGLSRLADIAHREITGGDGPYPVKKKGERRRLDPNWVAIAWLEAETLDATEIAYMADLEIVGMPGMLTLMAAGKARALVGRTSQCRRMIDVLSLDHSSSNPTSYHPCPDCDNFAVSWNCPEHPEGGKAPLFGETEGFRMPSAIMEAIQERTDSMAAGNPAQFLPPRHLQQGFADSWREWLRPLPEGSVTITFELSGMTYREWREENGIG